jgi:hypothetical protein
METVEVTVAPHIQRINSHSKLSDIVHVFQAPPVKVQVKDHWGKGAPLNKIRRNYYVQRIKSFAKKAQDPDMNMTLNEIHTGVKTSEQMTLTLLVYLLGVLVIFWNT